MIRTIRIFKLHLINIFQHRARAFVWFLIALFNPILYLLYWNGTDQSTPSLISYYLFLIIAGGALMSHIEDDIADLDIKQAGLIKYILRPFSYYWMKFFGETSYRMSQAVYGLIAFIVIVALMHPHLTVVTDPLNILLTAVIWVLATCISFTYKMILGIITFWTTESKGIFQISDLLIIIFGGYIMPLTAMPPIVLSISNFLPFGYIIYYPIAAITNQLDTASMLVVIAHQLFWIAAFYLVYIFLWKKGVREFTGVGQ